MESSSSTEETWSDWDGDNRNVAIGSIVCSALVAGVIAYVIRRRRQAEERTLAGRASRLAETARDALGDDRLSTGRDFLTDTVLPEFKPALRALLRELEGATEQAFRRAERRVNDL